MKTHPIIYVCIIVSLVAAALSIVRAIFAPDVANWMDVCTVASAIVVIALAVSGKMRHG